LTELAFRFIYKRSPSMTSAKKSPKHTLIATLSQNKEKPIMNSNWAEVRMQMDQMLEIERVQASLRRQHTPRFARLRMAVLGLVLLLALTLATIPSVP
jgi:hypothetical protein